MNRSWKRILSALVVVGLGISAQQNAEAAGFVVVSGDDADDYGHCSYLPDATASCGGLYPALLSRAIATSSTGSDNILVIGANSDFALDAFNNWNNPANGGPGAPVTFANSVPTIETVSFADYAVVYIASVENHTFGGMTAAQLAALNTRAAAIATYVNGQGGSLLALTEANTVGGWGWLPVPLTTQDTEFDQAAPTADLTDLAPATTAANLSHCCFHNVFTGPPGYSGLDVLAVATNAEAPFNGLPVMLGGLGTILTAEVCNDGIDNDGDGLVDNADPDCHVCGDGDLDPAEQCDDGNNVGGDGCSATCQIECPDADADGVCNAVDNCAYVANPDQADGDGDGDGNVCDNCATVANPDQADGDSDGLGTLCDNCPAVANPDQADADGDGRGNVCDNCTMVPNADQANADGDALGDVCDACTLDAANDADADGVCGNLDACASTPTSDLAAGVPSDSLGTNRWADLDGNGVFDTNPPNGHGPQLSFTMQDTHGCNCSQIIVALGLGLGHRKFGCSSGAMRDWIALVTP